MQLKCLRLPTICFIAGLVFLFLQLGFLLDAGAAPKKARQGLSQELSKELSQELSIVSTIAPIHALLLGLTNGAQHPQLLASLRHKPHGASLPPSQVRLLDNARLVVLLGGSFESFAASVDDRDDRRVVRLMELDGITRIRIAGASEDSDEHEGHDGHDGHDGQAAHGDANGFDPHIWLDPLNARAIVMHLGVVLTRMDPQNAALYRENGKRMVSNLRALDEDIAKEVSGLRGKFLVLHDSTAYFAARYGISGQENLHGVNHNATRDGMRHTLYVRRNLRRGDYRCVLVQQGLAQKLRNVIEDEITAGDTKIVEIDPLGVGLPLDENAYGEILRGVSSAFIRCLTAS